MTILRSILVISLGIVSYTCLASGGAMLVALLNDGSMGVYTCPDWYSDASAILTLFGIMGFATTFIICQNTEDT